jgi:hypothetical protein
VFESIYEASGSWKRVNNFQVKRSSPSVFLMSSMDLLLFFSHHEPVERAHDEV